MATIEKDTFLWVEKYRPKNLEEVIASEEVKKKFRTWKAEGQIPHLLLGGAAGIGKTTLARAICHEIGADVLYINASNENGVDVIRTKITQFASTMSLGGNLKVVLMDESDQLSLAAMGTLRATMEEFADNTRFILTCNFKNKLIDAIHSRCTFVDFSVSPDEKKKLIMHAWKRCIEILEIEKVEADKKVVAHVVDKYFPDMRRVLNALQQAAATGKIDASALASALPVDSLYESMRNKKWGEMRAWVAQNSDDPQGVIRAFFDELTKLFDGPTIPNIVIMLDAYQERLTRVADPELTLTSLCTEIMATAQWK